MQPPPGLPPPPAGTGGGPGDRAATFSAVSLSSRPRGDRLPCISQRMHLSLATHPVVVTPTLQSSESVRGVGQASPVNPVSSSGGVTSTPAPMLPTLQVSPYIQLSVQLSMPSAPALSLSAARPIPHPPRARARRLSPAFLPLQRIGAALLSQP